MPTLTDILGSDGALVRVVVGLSRRQRSQLFAGQRPVPPPLTLTAIIDTGAEITTLDTRFVRQLALTPVRALTPVNAPGLGGLSLSGSYDIDLTILHPTGNPADNLAVHDLVAAELPLGVYRIDLLIGRDVLALCQFHYDGPAGSFTLSY